MMADSRKNSSFLCLRHPEKLPVYKNPSAEVPKEDAADFSYLVEEGVLAPGNEHETYYNFVNELIDDAKCFVAEVATFPYLKITKGSVGSDLFHLTNEISYFKQEMDKIEREFTTLDFGPKEYAVLEVVVWSRPTLVSQPLTIMNSSESLATDSTMYPSPANCAPASKASHQSQSSILCRQGRTGRQSSKLEKNSLRLERSQQAVGSVPYVSIARRGS